MTITNKKKKKKIVDYDEKGKQRPKKYGRMQQYVS